MLRYPFVAPAVVQQNIELLMNDALNALLPAVGLALIVYLLARRYGLEMSKRAFGGRVSQAYERGFGHQIFSNYLLLGCLVMATPLIAVITQIAIQNASTAPAPENPRPARPPNKHQCAPGQRDYAPYRCK